MPKQVITAFQKWEFSNLEFYAATRLTELNLMFLQTLIATEAENKLALKIDLSKAKEEAVSEFIQQEAEMQGAIRILEYLIALHADVKMPEEAKKDEKVTIGQTLTVENRKGT